MENPDEECKQSPISLLVIVVSRKSGFDTLVLLAVSYMIVTEIFTVDIAGGNAHVTLHR